jgi:hypothetical protein
MKAIKYIFILALLFPLSSCNDYLDVNEDPNRSASAEAGPIFTGVVVGYSNNRTIDLGPAISTAGQMWSGGGSFGAGVFTRPERYIFSIFTTGNTWRAHYRDIQKDLKLAIANSEGRGNSIAQCQIMSAMTYWTTTMLWGDVPYTQAVDVDFDNVAINELNPQFDGQETVLNGVLDLLDQAIANIDPATPNAITANDLLYSGNMDNWRKFAKSLKLRTLMTMVDADPSKAGEIADLIAEGDLITDPSENAEFPFFAVSGNRNPFWETLNAFAGASNFFYFASEAMVEAMRAKNDPRMDVYFEPYPGGGSSDTIYGAPAGVTDVTGAVGSTPWVLSTAPVGSNGTVELVRPDAPDVLFSAQETHYLIAEAVARGLAPGGLATADQVLRDGIRIAMSGYNIDAAVIEDYLSNEIPDLSSVSNEEARVMIAEQAWIDCVVRPVEGFTSQRRTDVPTLQLPEGANVPGLCVRLDYPPDELAANTNAPAPVLANVKMWFDVN